MDWRVIGGSSDLHVGDVRGTWLEARRAERGSGRVNKERDSKGDGRGCTPGP